MLSLHIYIYMFEYKTWEFPPSSALMILNCPYVPPTSVIISFTIGSIWVVQCAPPDVSWFGFIHSTVYTTQSRKLLKSLESQTSRNLNIVTRIIDWSVTFGFARILGYRDNQQITFFLSQPDDKPSTCQCFPSFSPNIAAFFQKTHLFNQSLKRMPGRMAVHALNSTKELRDWPMEGINVSERSGCTARNPHKTSQN